MLHLEQKFIFYIFNNKWDKWAYLPKEKKGGKKLKLPVKIPSLNVKDSENILWKLIQKHFS